MSHKRIARGLWRWKTWDSFHCSFHCTCTALAVHHHSQHHCLYVILQQLDKQQTMRKKDRKRKKKLVCLTTNQWQHLILSMKTKMSPVHADGWCLRKNKQPQKKGSSSVSLRYLCIGSSVWFRRVSHKGRTNSVILIDWSRKIKTRI
jgi:hypothetical protein